MTRSVPVSKAERSKAERSARFGAASVILARSGLVAAAPSDVKRTVMARPMSRKAPGTIACDP